MIMFLLGLTWCGLGTGSSTIRLMTILCGILGCLMLAYLVMFKLAPFMGFCGSTTGTLKSHPTIYFGSWWSWMVLGNEIEVVSFVHKNLEKPQKH